MKMLKSVTIFLILLLLSCSDDSISINEEEINKPTELKNLTKWQEQTIENLGNRIEFISIPDKGNYILTKLENKNVLYFLAENDSIWANTNIDSISFPLYYNPDNDIILTGNKKSNDKGTTWINYDPVLSVSQFCGIGAKFYAVGYKSGYNNSPSEIANCYSARNFAYSDLGENWQTNAYGFGCPFQQLHSIVKDSEDNLILFSYNEGIFVLDKSLNSLDSFTSSFYSYPPIIIDNKDNIFAFSYNNDLLLSNTKGKTWTTILTQVYRAIALTKDDIIIAASKAKGIFYSNDNGTTWISLEVPEGIIGISKIFIDENNDLFIISGENRIFKSNCLKYIE